MSCPHQRDVQACLDGEMDAVACAAVERHVEDCAECAGLTRDIAAIRDGLREAPYYPADKKLRHRVREALDRETGRRRLPAFWKGAVSGGLAVALAASLMLVLVRPSPQDEVAQDAVAAHVRSLMGTHLVDVASSDHHTVKPWFAGHTDIAPTVEDYTKDGFHLVGGRVDYVHGERAAVVVYRRGGHVVNVFAWKNDGAARPGSRSRNGYKLLAWRSGDLFYCAVSDTTAEELQKLAHLMQG